MAVMARAHQSTATAGSVEARFSEAVAVLVEEIKHDRSVLAAMLCGSLSHDAVWEKSDVDLVLITIDDRKVEAGDIALYANGVNVHALLMPRAEFRKAAEGSMRNSFIHTFLTKGRLLYTHDETIAGMCEGLREIGERDTKLQLLRAGTNALPSIYKAHKFLETRGDLDYTALWILMTAWSLARVEVIRARRIADRDVLPQAMQLNPAFFRVVYTDLLNAPKTRESVENALAAVDAYVEERALELFGPIIEHLREVGEARSSREIENHFARNVGLSGVTTACEYLADQGLIGKASTAVRLTKRSNVDVQELAFFHRG